MATRASQALAILHEWFATHSPVVPWAADDCIARMMRKSTRARSPSNAALLLIGHPGSCLDRRRGRACLLLALVGGPTKDQPLPAVVRCREAATGRSPG
jgi:hypothetical protein